MSSEAITESRVRYASFWRRLAAFAFDWLIVLVVVLVVATLDGVIVGLVAAALSIDQANVDVVTEALGIGVSILIMWLYFAILESSDWQATCGKRMFGIRVTDMSGGRIGFWRATARHFAKLLSSLFVGFGFLMVFWTKQKQALHDGITGTIVVQRVASDTA